MFKGRHFQLHYLFQIFIFTLISLYGTSTAVYLMTICYQANLPSFIICQPALLTMAVAGWTAVYESYQAYQAYRRQIQ